MVFIDPNACLPFHKIVHIDQTFHEILSKKYPNLLPKALKIEARCSQKPLRRGSQKTIKTRTLCCGLWGPNVLQKGAQQRGFLKVFGVRGPVWAHRALRVDAESHNGAPEIKMGGKIGVLEVYLEPRIGIFQ